MITSALFGLATLFVNLEEDASDTNTEMVSSEREMTACHAVERCEERFFCPEIFVEVKAGYFFPISDRFSDVYSGSGIYGLEATVEMYQMLYGYLGAEYYREKTHVKGNQNYSCSVELVRPYIGLKAIARGWDSFRPYLGGAFQEAYVRNKNSLPLLIQKQNHWGPGAIFQVGFLYEKSHFVLDIFLDYSWLTIPMSSSVAKPVVVNRQNLSGFTLGGGLGYRF